MMSVGAVVDTFAPTRDDDWHRINREDRGDLGRMTRTVVRIVMSSPLFAVGSFPLSLEGEAAFGARSADCESVTCLNDATDILRAATSTEAFVTPRLRFATLQAGKPSPLGFYGFARFGFFGLANTRNFFRSIDFGGELRVERGTYEGSYATMSWGQNSLLAPGWGRYKYDAFVTWSVAWPWWRLITLRTNPRPYFRIRVDADLGPQPDAIQVFYGVTVNLARISGWR